MISLFSLRPPELLSVFTNQGDYFRCCYIEKKSSSKEEIDKNLSIDLNLCPWYDCLDRKIKIRKLAIQEVLTLVSKNIDSLHNKNDTSEGHRFSIQMNTVVHKMIISYQRYLAQD